jgi:predicted ATPase
MLTNRGPSVRIAGLFRGDVGLLLARGATLSGCQSTLQSRRVPPRGCRREDAAAAKLGKLAALLSRSGNTTPETVAVFADLLGLPTAGRYSSPPTDPRERRELILSTLVGQLDALARYRPVLFVFEDAHWIDSTSLALLERVTERVRRLPVLMIVTCRPEFEPP